MYASISGTLYSKYTQYARYRRGAVASTTVFTSAHRAHWSAPFGESRLATFNLQTLSAELKLLFELAANRTMASCCCPDATAARPDSRLLFEASQAHSTRYTHRTHTERYRRMESILWSHTMGCLPSSKAFAVLIVSSCIELVCTAGP